MSKEFQNDVKKIAEATGLIPKIISDVIAKLCNESSQINDLSDATLNKVLAGVAFPTLCIGTAKKIRAYDENLLWKWVEKSK